MAISSTTRLGSRVLIADDQEDVLSALELLLKAEGYETDSVTSPGAVLESIRNRDYDVLLVDLNYARDTTSGQEGLDLLSSVRAFDKSLPVIAMTAWGSVELAVEAMRGDLREFIQKPWDNDYLLGLIEAQIVQGRSVRHAESTKSQEEDEARSIQRALMPSDVSNPDGFHISHDWRPVRHVGGDYFDVLPLSETSRGICIADVVGKGMPAALLMSNVQALVHAYAAADVAPESLCRKVNRTLASNIPDNKFVTLFYGILDAGSGCFAYTNAGHNNPIVVRENGATEQLTDGGLVVGALSDWDYECGEIRLLPGDRLVLYTDGVNEAMDPSGREFGEDHLIDLARAHRAESPDALRGVIMDAVDHFCEGIYLDDVTVMVIGVD
ncbi:MAG: SpoIIE family protein phosphatase [Candidatus Latescibacteria bacterium]|nr:SpoIIE family protein phosphatase [Candidatus Latescibacterota bacterium]